MPGHRPTRARPHRARLAPAIAMLAVAAAVAACGSANSSEPTWRPQPSFSGDGGRNATNEVPGAPSSSGSDGPGTGSSGPSGSSTSQQDPNVVATKLTAPTGVAILPDMSALVGERTTGQIVHVQPTPGKPTPVVKTIPGLSTSGDGGLLDLMLSPYYDSDGLIYAYITTATDNEIVEFTLTGPITPVLTGIPGGAAGNTARLATDGRYVYLATGDAGAASGPTTLNGNILRVTDIGAPVPDNPTAGSPVYATGASVSPGLCYSTDLGLLFRVGSDARIDVVTAGADLSGSAAQVGALPSGSLAPGGCAVDSHTLYVTSTDGQSLLAASIKSTSGGRVALGKFESVVSKTYGRLLTVASAADGSLWLTTTNKDGKGKPVPTDERVIRIIAAPAGGGDVPV